MSLRRIWDAKISYYNGGRGSVTLNLDADDGEDGRPIRLVLDEGTLIALLDKAHNGLGVD
jgi:hypothetical protein